MAEAFGPRLGQDSASTGRVRGPLYDRPLPRRSARLGASTFVQNPSGFVFFHENLRATQLLRADELQSGRLCGGALTSHTHRVSARHSRLFHAGGPRTIKVYHNVRRRAMSHIEHFVTEDECPKNATSPSSRIRSRSRPSCHTTVSVEHEVLRRPAER